MRNFDINKFQTIGNLQRTIFIYETFFVQVIMIIKTTFKVH